VPSSGEQPSSAQSHATVLVNCPFATTDIVFCVKNGKNDLMKTASSESEQGFSDHDNLDEKAATAAYYPFILADSAEWRKSFDITLHD
jgi:hypothetical protein